MAVRVVFALLIMACCITASPFGIEKLINITITVPDQTQIHNDPKQICIPPKWYVTAPCLILQTLALKIDQVLTLTLDIGPIISFSIWGTT